MKSVGSEGVESEYSVTGEITSFGKAEGIMTTTDGDSVVWKLCYAGKASGAGGKLTGTVTFMTRSEKLAWLHSTICVMKSAGDAEVGTNIFYEWG